MVKSCIIVGGGVSGLTAALALARIGIQCRVYELRQSPSTIGGAVNLTPNGLRLLNNLGVAISGPKVEGIEIFSMDTGHRLGELSFSLSGGSSIRILRNELLDALLAAVKRADVPILYSSKLVSIGEDREGTVIATFANGTSTSASFLVGCDGVHSAVRTSYVQPERVPVYTGVSAAYAFVPSSLITADIHFRATALSMGRKGSFLTSYVDEDKSRIYFAAIMEMKEQASKEGWRARGADHESTLRELRRRYIDSALPCIPEMIQHAEDVFLYPIFVLPREGTWSRGRVLLLGDASHAVGPSPKLFHFVLLFCQMPPQGESVGLALEDAVLFPRILASSPEQSLPEVFARYERNRRDRIDVAWKEADARWENAKDKSWLYQKVLEWKMWLYLWWQRDHLAAGFDYDVLTVDLSP